ncbi:A-kinase anchor protein 1, mitochondrial-like [Ptychodera flava]|uniref:A-kinase anchor protein 1, mitochondrial-like n=1 Tax=Ptychodera flava TaxID=63121 RepID=UPI00396A1D0A
MASDSGVSIDASVKNVTENVEQNSGMDEVVEEIAAACIENVHVESGQSFRVESVLGGPIAGVVDDITVQVKHIGVTETVNDDKPASGEANPVTDTASADIVKDIPVQAEQHSDVTPAADSASAEVVEDISVDVEQSSEVTTESNVACDVKGELETPSSSGVDVQKDAQLSASAAEFIPRTFDDSRGDINQPQGEEAVLETSSDTDSGVQLENRVLSDGVPSTNQRAEAQTSDSTSFASAGDVDVARNDTDSPFSPYSGSLHGSEASSEAISDISSNDSGRGLNESSDQSNPSQSQNLLINYEFEFPTKLCGRLIGKGGKNMKQLRDKSGAWVVLKKLQFDTRYQLCVITGSQSAVDLALAMITEKFPDVDVSRTTVAMDGTGIVPPGSQLTLPDGQLVPVIVSSIVTGGHVFVQQPTHPTYPALAKLYDYMLDCYSSSSDSPDLERPLELGQICAVELPDDGWYRAEIMNVCSETDEVDVRFGDYGGYSRVPASNLKKVRSDFMRLPFQASECYLASVAPLEGETEFSAEAFDVLSELTQGSEEVQAEIVGYYDNIIPVINLFQILPDSSYVYINQELIDRGLVSWSN